RVPAGGRRGAARRAVARRGRGRRARAAGSPALRCDALVALAARQRRHAVAAALLAGARREGLHGEADAARPALSERTATWPSRRRPTCADRVDLRGGPDAHALAEGVRARPGSIAALRDAR